VPQPKVSKPFVKFAPKGTPSFYDSVKAEVAAYFESRNISELGNRKMYIKTVVMLSLYFVPLALMISGVASSLGLVFFYLMWMLMGIGIVGIGVSVMHDSNHGAYSNNKTLNTMLGNVLNVIGGFSLNWKIQHNILHHTYTNLAGLDEDIEAGGLLRMSPDKPHSAIHRFQHIYALGLYAIMNLYWVTAKDYLMLIRYNKHDLLKKQKTTFAKAMMQLSLLKVFYFSLMLVLPVFTTGLPFAYILYGFLGMHIIAGLALALIFQPAHVMETSEFPVMTPGRKMENSWAVHQILNTANFCPNSTITSWFIGGLNYQIEHHLFPHICHVHYPELSKIVARVAAQYSLPYQVQPTFLKAIVEHLKMLRKLGQEKTPVLVKATHPAYKVGADLAEAI
jgi:linoleoyl-CoA desaturase